MEIAGRRITVMGLGRHGGGVAAARWLAEQGAAVTVTDLASVSKRPARVDRALNRPILPIAAWTLGRHDEADFAGADAVVVNPAVRPDHPLVAKARTAGARITSEIELFLDRCPARVVGVTGSNGKSSTATMLDRHRCVLPVGFGLAWVADITATALLSLAWRNPNWRRRGAGAEQFSTGEFKRPGPGFRSVRSSPAVGQTISTGMVRLSTMRRPSAGLSSACRPAAWRCSTRPIARLCRLAGARADGRQSPYALAA